MARGPRVTNDVKGLVIKAFDNLWQQLGGRGDQLPTGVAVRDEVARLIERDDWPDPVPSERMVQKILEGPRKQAREVRPIDVPWSLGWNMSEGAPDPWIPTDAIADILEVKKYSIIVGRPFTVRQARWVALLRNVPRAGMHPLEAPHLRKPAGLFVWSETLAGRQRRSELAEAKLDTSDIDPVLAMDNHLRGAAIFAGVVPPYSSDNNNLDRGAMGLKAQHGLASIIVNRFEGGEAPDHFDDDYQKLIEEAGSLLSSVRSDRKAAITELWRFWLYELEGHVSEAASGTLKKMNDLALRLLERITSFEKSAGDVPDDISTFEEDNNWELFSAERATQGIYIPEEFFEEVGYDATRISEERRSK